MIQIFKNIKKSSETKREILIAPYFLKTSNWWLNGFLHRINFGYSQYINFNLISKSMLILKIKDFALLKKIYFIFKDAIVLYLKESFEFLLVLDLKINTIILNTFFSLSEESYSMIKLFELNFLILFKNIDFLKFYIPQDLIKTSWFYGFQCIKSFLKINSLLFQNNKFFYFSFFLAIDYFISLIFLNQLSLIFKFKIFLYSYLKIIYYSFENIEFIFSYLEKYRFNNFLSLILNKTLLKYFNLTIFN